MREYNAEAAEESFVRDIRVKYGAAANGITPREVEEFRAIIYGYYRKHRREFPWRDTDDPYHIVVSEVMLQQTQTDRVVPKYLDFIAAFPTVGALAGASLREVMAVWQGLGYNRRARFLHELAGEVMRSHRGLIPDSPGDLARLPGIGLATASSICAFAFNMPVVFVETNIRSLFIHFFFQDSARVKDRDIMPLVELTLDRKNPRGWYSALMDYGVMLKRRHQNPGRRSAHYQKQSPFEGSTRQIRGRVIRNLLSGTGMTLKEISASVGKSEDQVRPVIDGLADEGLIMKRGRKYRITSQ